MSKKLIIVGIGGGGQNIVDYVSKNNTNLYIETFIINSDEQVLENAKTKNKILIGPETIYTKFLLFLTNNLGINSQIITYLKKFQIKKSLGCGGNVEEGEIRMKKYLHKLKFMQNKSDLIILVSCFGGGFGTGATPVIANYLKEMNKDFISITITPFYFEGQKRLYVALNGIKKLKNINKNCIVIDNNNFIKDSHLSMKTILDGISKIVMENIFDVINDKEYYYDEN